MKRNGFTFIELFVVITIIAVITVVGMINYGVTNRKARDSKRVADVEKIRIALEMARQIGTTYPAPVGNTASALVPNYMSALPKEPKNGNDYVYDSTNYTYTIGTSMEDLGSTNMAAVGGINYQVKNP
ncbi:MAG: prepilin-type N-terminal cleavage/methylation domain-containing protein [Candidatus Shapirobacteria bacterium]|nr:prepilin-type N-terminal cleavage/methylation domain-containing protein [Candidatus Shapirobacteria bacterium]